LDDLLQAYEVFADAGTPVPSRSSSPG